LEPRGKRKKETRKLHNEEPQELYSSPDIMLSFQIKETDERGMWRVRYREE
jgi:hypothetical protein